MLFLAGDVGGTKTRLAIFSFANGILERHHLTQYRSADYPNVQTIISHFLKETQALVNVGCIGVPGPVANGRVKVTNLPWELSETEIEQQTGLRRLRLVNDLLATAAGIPHLSGEQLASIYQPIGERIEGPMAVVAPGTGLGQAFLVRDDHGRPVPIPSEGGHAVFAPTTDEERDLHAFLAKKYSVASVERALCGPGISNIFDFLVSTGRYSIPSDFAEELSNAKDRAAVVSNWALSAKTDICVHALEMFTSILASHAGNMVLTLLATGGLYLGGGIPPKIVPLLNTEHFRKAFLNKGKLTHVVEKTPVSVVLDDHAAVIGAAWLASRLERAEP